MKISPAIRVRPGLLWEGTAVLGAILLWGSLRVFPAIPTVFPEVGSPVLLGNDPWFHLHQSIGAIEHFPHLIRWDVGSQYPNGSRVAAAGLFNLAAAALSLPFGGEAANPTPVIRVLAWSPVVLGALSLLLLYALARELGGAKVAGAAVLVRILFPGGELERTMLGFGDYHSAEICLATMSLWLFVRFLRLPRNGNDARLLWIRGAIAALPITLFQFVWFGASLHVAMILVAFGAAMATGIGHGEAVKGILLRSVPYFAGAFVLVGGAGLLFPGLVMVPLSFRDTLAVFALAVPIALLAAGFLAPLVSRIGIRATFVWGGFGATAAVVGVFSFSDRLRRQAEKFLLPRSPFISEHIEVGPALGWEIYGAVLVWIPVGLLFAFSKRASPGERVALFYLAGWTILWITSSDFGYLAGALLPLAAGLGMVRFGEMLARKQWRTSSALRHLPAATVGISLLLAPSIGSTRPPFLSRDEVAEMVLATPPWREAMEWVEKNTPSPSIPPTFLAEPWRKKYGFAYPDGAYGVFTHWQFGNLVCALGRRIAVSARSRTPTFIDWFLEREESASLARLDLLGDVPYLVLDAISVCDSFVSEAIQAGVEIEEFQIVEGRTSTEWGDLPILSYGETLRGAVGARLYLGDGTGMAHYRLIHESKQWSFIRYRLLPEIEAVSLKSTLVADEEERGELFPLTEEGASWTEDGGAYFCYSGQLTPAVKIFERVAGAVVEGDFEAGAPVRIELQLHSTHADREILYQQSGEADESGKVRVVLPYPTDREPHPYSVRATGPYRIRIGDAPWIELEVSEEEVRMGKAILFGPQL